MPAKPRCGKRAQSYFPPVVFELLEKRAEKNFNSISHELVLVVSEFLTKEAQQQEQPNEPATV